MPANTNATATSRTFFMVSPFPAGSMGTSRAPQRTATRRPPWITSARREGSLLEIEDLDAQPVLLVALDEDLVVGVLLVGVVVRHGVERHRQADIVGGVDDVPGLGLRGHAGPEVLHGRGLQILARVLHGLLRRALGGVLLHPEKHGVDQHRSLPFNRLSRALYR